MKKLIYIYKNSSYNLICILFFIFLSSVANSNQNLFEIQGNEFVDSDVILSLLTNIPDSIEEEYSNEIIKILNNSNLFADVKVKLQNNKYILIVKEYPSINKFYFKNNERLEDEELELIASQLNFNKLNSKSIDLFINEIKKVYESFGYNNIKIQFSENFYETTNTVDVFFEIDEGKITKINKIIVSGNQSLLDEEIKQIIKSKTKNIRNIFANNNFKPGVVERDKYLIKNHYKNIGFIDIKVNTQIEYLKTNRVNVYYEIDEGELYFISLIEIKDSSNLLNDDISNLINTEINDLLDRDENPTLNDIQDLKNHISSIILNNSIQFFEINMFEKTVENKINFLFEIVPIKPKYTKQINIVGNYRTFDYVIRRELSIVEGDVIYPSQLQNVKDKLASLNLFESITLKEELIDENTVNLIIEVEEKQTGTFNAGVSVGTLDGFSIVTGLKERNFYGTGRSLDVLINTSEEKTQYKLITTDRLSNENNANISYSLNYRLQDFSKASSYKLDTFSAGIGLGYMINDNLFHNFDLEYVLKDYKITNSSTVSNAISDSSGANMSYLIKNNIRYSTLNSGFIPRKGNYINFNNTIETPTSSSNGFVRNILNAKKYHNNDRSIYGIQAKLGNIFSLNNNDILTDDKFALGGRWLRGFDNFGAGPRNSRTSYVGGNNIAVLKFDYSYEISNQSNFPFYFNIFNDYGLIWENKTKPTQNDNSLRSSAGFGIKYYSPIGPIGLTWGFPIMEEDYDIKRMFLFSIGNID